LKLGLGIRSQVIITFNLHFINDLLLTQGTTLLGSHWPNKAVITLCIDENVIIVLYMDDEKRAPLILLRDDYGG
jgi:hypothetical protein